MAKKSTKAAIVTAPLPVLSETQVKYFPLSQIRAKEGYNLRMFDPQVSKEDESFLQTIITAGRVNVPVTATVDKDGMIVLQTGNRRVAAARIAESSGAVKPFPAIPVLAVREGQTETEATYDLFVSNNGKALSPIEQAKGVARLRGLGESDIAISKTIGCSAQWVKMLGIMATLPDYLATAVYAEHIAGTFAAELFEASKRAEGGFDLAKVWERASTVARKAGTWDGNRYVWKLSLKHVDPVLKELGLTMAKSRNVEKITPERVTPAWTPSDVPTSDVTSESTSERAPRPGSNPPASQVSAKADAERQIAADRANGEGKKAAPDSTPLYAVRGETILDANGNPLATCDTEQAASRIARILNASGERIVCAPMNGTPTRATMTDAEKKAASDAAERAEKALVNSALAKTANAKAAEQTKAEQAKAALTHKTALLTRKAGSKAARKAARKAA